jgi:hypothetical protein
MGMSAKNILPWMPLFFPSTRGGEEFSASASAQDEGIGCRSRGGDTFCGIRYSFLANTDAIWDPEKPPATTISGGTESTSICQILSTREADRRSATADWPDWGRSARRGLFSCQKANRIWRASALRSFQGYATLNVETILIKWNDRLHIIWQTPLQDHD